MGVLSDGTPFLTQRGLARLCGVAQCADRNHQYRVEREPAEAADATHPRNPLEQLRVT